MLIADFSQRKRLFQTGGTHRYITICIYLWHYLLNGIKVKSIHDADIYV
jgi:hypothetical protein